MNKLDNLQEALTFDDVLLIPQYSFLLSRSEVDLSWKLGKFKFSLPIIAANMDTICGEKMATKMGDLGGLGIIHRRQPVYGPDECYEVTSSWWAFKNRTEPLAFSVGSIHNDRKRIDWILDREFTRADIVCIDIAHGDSIHMVDTLQYIRDNGFDGPIIAGNVCTPEATRFLLEHGATMVKVGVGPGCLAGDTRILMADGTYKNIKDIIPGDRVINKDGRPVTVLRNINSGFRSVKKLHHAQFYKDTYITSDHKMWIGDLNSVSSETLQNTGYAKSLDKKSKTKPKQSKYKWKEVQNLQQDMFLFPRNIQFELPNTFCIKLEDYSEKPKYLKDYNVNIVPSYSLGYIFGTFLGDGNTHLAVYKNSKRGSVHWSFELNENEIANKLANCIQLTIGKRPSITIKDNKVLSVNLFSKQWAEFFNQFGKRTSKHLPKKFICSETEYLTGLLDGLNDSDGHKEDYGRFGITNTSVANIELYNFLCIQLLGLVPSHAKKGQLIQVIKDKKYICNQAYTTRVGTRLSTYQTKDYQAILPLSIEDSIVIETFDIEVDCPTHSFIANNTIVHNSVCTTRIKTGCGYPQLSAIANCAEVGPIIADGGIRTPGDACVVGSTRILMKDLTWKRADEIQAGEQVIGFDEEPKKRSSKLKRRQFKTAEVVVNKKQELPCMTVFTDRGDVTVSTDHKWLCRTTKGNRFEWKKTKDLTNKDKIVFFGDPWEEDLSKESGYVSGFLDGEGSCSSTVSNNKKSNSISVSQAIGQTADKFYDLCSKFAEVSRVPRKWNQNPKHKKQECFQVHGIYNQLRLLGVTRPERLLSQAESFWNNLTVMNMDFAQVFKVEDAGLIDTYTVSTSTETFIAEGFMSHNCKALAAGAKAVMIGGMLAGTDCVPGWTKVMEERKQLNAQGVYLGPAKIVYRGMASKEARQAVGEEETNAEGVSKSVECKPAGSTEAVIIDIAEGVRSAMSYSGAHTLGEFSKRAQFVRVTSTTQAENHPHFKG